MLYTEETTTTPTTSPMKFPKARNVGLLVIAITLLVIVLTGVILMNAEQQRRMDAIRSDGATLTRILSDMPRQQLSSSSSNSGLIQLLKNYSSDNALVYVVVADKEGRTVNEIGAHGIRPPDVVFSESEPLWLNQHYFHTGDSEIIEFRKPILGNQQQVVGYVRSGYVSPEMSFPGEDASLLAQIALPIFLLVPVFYFLLYREMKPLHYANSQLLELSTEHQSTELTARGSGEFDQFLCNFNDFMTAARQKMSDLEQQKADAFTSNKILTYHKKRVETTLQTLPDAVIVIDETGTVTFANQQVNSLIGLAPDEIIGKQTVNWCNNDAMAALLSRYHGNVTSIKRAEGIEFSPVHSPAKTISVRAYPLFSPKDTSVVLGTVVVLRDITEDVMAKRARDEFVAHVSHELKSPLNVIGMHSELLLDLVTDEDSKLINSVNIIQEEINRLAQLIDDLLNITQIETGSVALNRQRVKLKEFLEDILETFRQPALQKDISLELDVSADLSAMNIDKELMRVAINNLLTNAIKYNDPGGSVSLFAEESSSEVIIRVADTGIGISQQDLNHVFDKFYRSETDKVRERSGHGLGLSLAHEVITLHHGELSVQSEYGEGTTFTIALMKTSTLLKEVS